MSEVRASYPTGDGMGWVVERNGYQLTVPFWRTGKPATGRWDFSRHPLRDVVLDFLLHNTEAQPGGTIRSNCQAMRRLEEGLRRKGQGDLSAEAFHVVVRWMLNATRADGSLRWTEAQVGTSVGVILAFYEFGIGKQPGWFQSVHETMSRLRTNALRGLGRRAVIRSQDKTITDDEFTWLLRAVKSDLVALKEHFSRYSTDPHSVSVQTGDGALPFVATAASPNPVIVFGLLAALCYGLRASELNVLKVNDLDRERKHLKLSPPDKPPTQLMVGAELIEAFDLCVAWGSRAREELGTDALLCITTIVGGVRPNGVIGQESPTQSTVVTTRLLNEFYLPKFYERHFDVKVWRAGEEQPLLHCERSAPGEPFLPFRSNYKKLRNAFVLIHIDLVGDPAETQRVARHSSYKTTIKNYSHRAKISHAQRVASSLKRMAAIVGTGMELVVHEGTEQRRRELAAQERLVPSGGCLDPSGVTGCTRNHDCLYCPFLELHASAVPIIENDRDACLREADQLAEMGFPRDAENRRTRAAHLQAQIDRIHVAMGHSV